MEKTMQGALFLNDKGDNEARPDFRGKLTLDEGKILQVSAWKSVSRDGKPYLSCKCDCSRFLWCSAMEYIRHGSTRVRCAWECRRSTRDYKWTQ